MASPDDTNLLTVPAVLAYASLALLTLFGAGVLYIIVAGVTVPPVMLGILGTMQAAVVAAVSGAFSYYYGTSSQTKKAGTSQDPGLTVTTSDTTVTTQPSASGPAT